MKIILATPIYPPEIGGPAQYVKNLAEGLKERGIEPKVISYNSLKKYPQPFRFFFYFFILLKKAKKSQIIYAFNLVSSGIPAYFASNILRKKFIVRIGGDYLWERAIESGRTKKPLKEYYQELKNLKEKFWLFLIKKILNSADKIIFTGSFLKNIYKKYFDIQEQKTVMIANPFPQIDISKYQPKTTDYQLLYAGRILKSKNLNIFLEVFKKIRKKTDKNLIFKIIGEGPEKKNLELKIKNLKLENQVLIQKPLPHQELLKEIQKSYLCVLPALTDVTPNFALECIKLQKPILLTKETDFYEAFKSLPSFIDPQNRRDIEEKLLYLLKEKNYQEYVKRLKNVPTFYSWNELIKKHILLFNQVK